MKKFYKMLATALISFSGGVLAVLFIGWLEPLNVRIATTGDAISVANTYIVFTTIIFVGVTVVLGVASYVFAQQFSASKETHETRLIDDLKTRLKDSETLSMELIKAILENEAVKAHLTETFGSKASQLLTDKITELELTSNNVFADIGNDLSVNGDGVNG